MLPDSDKRRRRSRCAGWAEVAPKDADVFAPNGASQLGAITFGTGGIFAFPSATSPFTWATGDTYRLTYIAQTL